MFCFDFKSTPRNISKNHTTPEIPEILLFEIEYIEITGSILLVV